MALDWMTPEQKAQLAAQVNPATAAKAGWLPAPPVANSPAELLGITPPPAPAAPPPAMVVGALPAAPPVMGDAGSPALLPAAPKPIAADVAPVPTAPVPMPPAAATGVPPMLAKPGTPGSPFPAPAAVGGGPAPMGGGGLPLQPPAPPAEGLYHGMDPLHVGTPGQQKLAAIEGRRMYGEGEALKATGAVDAGLAGDYAGLSQATLADADKRAADADKRAADRKAFLARYNADTEKQIDAYSKADIKPDRLWAGESGTANAVAAVIGAFTSGIAGYLDPSKDYVGQFANRIEQKIQQDIEVQKANIARRGAGLEARKGLYGSYLQQFGQEDAAEAMAYETYLRKTKAQIDSYASKATNEKAKIQLNELSAQIEDRQMKWAAGRQAAGEGIIDAQLAAQAKAQQAAYAAASGEARKRNEMVFKAQLSVAEERAKKIEGTPMVLSTPLKLESGAVLPAGSAVVLDKAGKINMEGTEAAQAAGVTVNIPVAQADGQVAYSTVPVNKAGHTEVAKQSAGAAKALGAIDRMEKAAAMPGPWVGKKYREYQAGLADYTTFYGVANNMGAISKEEGERIAKTTVPIPTWGAGYMTDSEQEQLAAQKAAISNSVKATATSFGPGTVAGPAPLPLKAPAPAGK